MRTIISKSQIKVMCDENIPLLAESLISCAEVITFKGRELRNSDLIENNCRALIVRSTTKINADLLEGTAVEFVGTATSGTDHIDLDYLNINKIQFADAPGSNANSVAELVVYSAIRYAEMIGESLRGKTIGIIGFGNIGKIVAKYAHNFEMNILINDPPLLDEKYSFPDYVTNTDIDTLCSESDILTNHVPLTKYGQYPTYGLLNAERINSMKQGALLIHSSRGFVVEEKPLIRRLKSKSLYASVDVWENEPLINPELVRLVFHASPHVGGYSRDGKLKGTMMMIKAFAAYSGLTPNTEAIDDELKSYKAVQAKKYSDADYIVNLLQEKRQFEADDKAMREMIDTPIEDRPGTFDMLRKKYPVRRESL
ncbi:MAG: 4-phosphoerythronate dehydrogenase [Candidatus Kapabacteria bacterium]|jgi:erythronate-4-phosphate dehydrogenase|nr:4-phosphoerythronate dehydrogenase [Candidatus Kapabacteria bacterium]